jgi:hypothetical protein
VPIELIYIQGERVETLREMLRPGLRAIFVGLNPLRCRSAQDITIKVVSDLGFGDAWKRSASQRSCPQGGKMKPHLSRATDSPIW